MECGKHNFMCDNGGCAHDQSRQKRPDEYAGEIEVDISILPESPVVEQGRDEICADSSRCGSVDVESRDADEDKSNGDLCHRAYEQIDYRQSHFANSLQTCGKCPHDRERDYSERLDLQRMDSHQRFVRFSGVKKQQDRLSQRYQADSARESDYHHRFEPGSDVAVKV